MYFLGVHLADEPSREEVSKADRTKHHFRIEQTSLKRQLLGSDFALFVLNMIDSRFSASLQWTLRQEICQTQEAGVIKDD